MQTVGLVKFVSMAFVSMVNVASMETVRMASGASKALALTAASMTDSAPMTWRV